MAPNAGAPNEVSVAGAPNETPTEAGATPPNEADDAGFAPNETPAEAGVTPNETIGAGVAPNETGGAGVAPNETGPAEVGGAPKGAAGGTGVAPKETDGVVVTLKALANEGAGVEPGLNILEFCAGVDNTLPKQIGRAHV